MESIRTLLFALTIGSVAVGGSIFAQPSAPPPSSPQPTTEEADTSNSDSTNASNEQTAPVAETIQLTPGEMSSQSEGFLGQMQESLVRVVELQQLAHKQQDIIKLNCVNDKLLQLKQLMNIAETSRTNMIEAIAQDDLDGTNHQFNQISIAMEKSDVLRDEAEACIGDELVFLGPTEVEMTAPAAADDPTAPDDFDVGEILEPPAYASPFL